MHTPARIGVTGALFLSSLAAAIPAMAEVADTTAARSAPTPAHGSIALASFHVGVRLATRVRFPVGVGLGLTVCTVGIVLEIDQYVRSR